MFPLHDEIEWLTTMMIVGHLSGTQAGVLATYLELPYVGTRDIQNADHHP
jgi:hypothetical protein